ncbi:MAG: tyrosine-type recombinase/integrase [Betaproteobacteria bacterium]|nr:tyrosine-type recombinase/integrase [Betaproteobacteria bacterium]
MSTDVSTTMLPRPFAVPGSAREPVPSPTLADALAALAGSTDIEAGRRKTWVAAISTTAKWIGRPPGQIPASLPKLRPLITALTPVTTGRSAKTLANTKSLVKAALTHLGLHRRVRSDGAPLAPEWQALYDQLPDKRSRNGLSRFIHYASRLGVTPDHVDQQILDRFVGELEASGEVAHVAHRHRDTAVLWNRAVSTIPGWPQTMLAEPTVDRTGKRLAPGRLHPELQSDVDRYLRWASGVDFMDDDAPAKGCKKSTLRLRREQLRIAASSLVATGMLVSEITSLRDLVDPVRVRALLTKMIEGSRAEVRAFVRGVAISLVALAKWCDVDPKDLAEIKRLSGKLGTQPRGLTEKNRALLNKFEDERILQSLLGLPAKLAAEARRTQSPARRVQRMQIALFLELLLGIPLRLQNLSQLEFGKHLLRPGGPGKPMQLVFNSDEVKNDQSMIFDVPATTQLFIDEYSKHFRPFLDTGISEHLFITQGGKPKSPDSLRHGVTMAVKRHVGIHMTPHQFRHLAAKLMLDANPGAYLLVQHLLGHKNFKTTVAFYAESQARNAGRVFDEVLAELRTSKKKT